VTSADDQAPTPLAALFPNGILIVGTGLIGTSAGLALRERGVRVWLTDHDPDVARLAAGLGAGELLGDTSGTIPAGISVDLAVLAVPPDVLAPVLAAAQSAGLARYYTDVASVKTSPLAQVRALGCDLTCYVPGHPLAGRERSGPAAARADLFEGRPWALCPLPETDPDAVALVQALVTGLGAEPVRTDASEHDRWVALVSHAPHLVASAMAARLAGAPRGALDLAGPGLRDVTRIAAGDSALWTQILAANATGVSEVLAQVADDLKEAAAALANPTDEAVKELTTLLDTGAAGVARLPGKHGRPAASYAIVQVVIPDQPGELALLFQAAGQAGVNIEDIRIEHSPGLPSGVAELYVKPPAAGPLVQALTRRGWPDSTITTPTR
jgi:prephenate dehydrogenase